MLFKRMTSASGFTWFAREPELIGGAEGARILTEINRLPQRLPQTPIENLTRRWRLQSAFRPERAVFLCRPHSVL